MTADPNNPDSLQPDLREERIGALLNDFFDRKSRGEAVDESAFLAQHAEFADELREHLRGLDLIRDLGSSGSAGSSDALDDRTRPAVGSSAVDALAPNPTPLPTIPGYDIKKQIGRGGMGIVYKAVQKSTARTVALKVLLEGPFATDVARRRFEREIALAAQLRHPNIIPIHDSGDIDGRLYYAMEHVYGQALNDYVRIHNLPTAARLKIFTRICDAVSHAHQRGVIHRDLKPGNILVDGHGVPHVLDFGLAKAGSLADANTSMTAQIIGTPAYMSPEQAAGDPGGIDTRSDAYSLGVMLYELIVGRMPYDTNVSIGKILHNIAHTEPVAPRKIVPDLDADLEAILLKALEKERDRRYQSVDALATDIRRHLDGAPISAVPVTGLYLVRKTLLRHRRITTVAVLLIVAGLSGSVLLRRSINNSQQTQEHVRNLEHDLTEQKQQLKELQEERARADQDRIAKAQQEAAAAKQALEMLTNLHMTDMPAEERKKVGELTTKVVSAFTSENKAAASVTALSDIVKALAEIDTAPTTQPSGQTPLPSNPGRAVKERPEAYIRALEAMRALLIQQMTGQPATAPAKP